MSQEFESDSEEIGCTRSGKRYKVDSYLPYLKTVQTVLENIVKLIEKEQ